MYLRQVAFTPRQYVLSNAYGLVVMSGAFTMEAFFIVRQCMTVFDCLRPVERKCLTFRDKIKLSDGITVGQK